MSSKLKNKLTDKLPQLRARTLSGVPTQSATLRMRENKTGTGSTVTADCGGFTASGVIPSSILVLFPAPFLFVQSALKIEEG